MGAEIDHEFDRNSETVEISVMDINERLSVDYMMSTSFPIIYHVVYSFPDIKATTARHSVAALVIDIFLAWETTIHGYVEREFERLLVTLLG